MLNLVIDAGNTYVKMALFSNRELLKMNAFSSLTQDLLAEFIGARTLDNVILSSVRNDVENLEKQVSHLPNYRRFSSSTKTRVKMHYKTPETFGLDRFAAVIGAAALFENKDSLVIDAGTCITYDFVDKAKNYYGGSISPGINIRYKGMNTFTGKLPLIEFDADFKSSYGNDTRTCMLSGVQNGILYEVKGFIQSYLSDYPDLNIILCGGDANYFDTQLKNSIFAPNIKTVPHLVMIGLNEVIEHGND